MRLNRWSVIIGSTSAVLGSVIMSFQSHGATPLPDDLQFVPTNSLPEQATWYSTQMWDNYPPSPFNWLAGRDDVLYYQSPSFGINKIIIDDSQVDYTAMQTSADGPPFPGDGNDGGTNYGGGGFISPKWGSNDLYLTINVDTNQPGYVDLILHGATNAYWQLLNKTNVAEVKPWTFGEILYDDGTTNELFYTPVPFDVPPFNFFRAVSGNNEVSIQITRYNYIAIEPDGQGNGGQDAQFTVSLKDQSTNDITVLYSVSGTAVPGIDYSNYPGVISSNMIGSVTIAANSLSQSVTVHPFHDPTLDFDEPAIFTVILTNGYVVDPANYVVTNIVRDNFGGSNIFSIVATNLPNPVGIDYSPAQQGLLLPINYNYNDPPFGLLNTNAVLSTWSSLTAIDVPNEIRIATVKTTTNGLTAGDMIFGNGTAGGIGWVSADGSSYDLNWVTITNEPNLVEGLYIDQTGVWSNDVLAVSGADAGLTGTNLNVWRIHFRTNIQLVASIPTMHLEGVLTVANDTRYGPWAGKLLTADENRHMIFSVDTDGVVSNYFLGINADQFRLVPTNQDLYCVAFNGPNSEVAKIPKAYLTAFVGDILVEQAGEVIDEPELFFVHWNGMNFESHGVPLRTFLGSDYFLEKSTFAPISMTPVQ